MSKSLAVLNTGLVVANGLSAPAACAAIRAGLSNPTETLFTDSAGEWIVGHQVALAESWRGRTKLVKMAALAIEECLADVPRADWTQVALLLCVAERDRPGRLDGLDQELFTEIELELDCEFAPQSRIYPHGRVSIGAALLHARALFDEAKLPHILVAATDSLLTAPTLRAYERSERLLTAHNPNGFMPGEGAAALLLGAPRPGQPQLLCTGVGVATEAATIDSETPLRADGLAKAIKAALADAGIEMHHVDFRITDLSGEQYYFKEAALALSRTLRVRKEDFDIWHPAECIGESGAVAGLAMIAVAEAACRKNYSRGPTILCHAAVDSGHRTAAVLQFRA